MKGAARPLAGDPPRADEVGTGGSGPTQGQPGSFETLFRETYGEMVRVALLLVGTRAEAEDVVQDAFARVGLRWKRINDPRGYLHRCVVNRSHDLLRRRRVEQRFRWSQREEASELDADELGGAVPARRGHGRRCAR